MKCGCPYFSQLLLRFLYGIDGCQFGILYFLLHEVFRVFYLFLTVFDLVSDFVTRVLPESGASSNACNRTDGQAAEEGK